MRNLPGCGVRRRSLPLSLLRLFKRISSVLLFCFSFQVAHIRGSMEGWRDVKEEVVEVVEKEEEEEEGGL